MKRIGYIFDETVSIDNLRAAHFDGRAAIRKKKKKQRRTKMRRAMAWESHLEENLERLHGQLIAGTYHSGEYHKKIVYEAGKWREIWYTTEWDDQVVQRAIMRTLGVKLEKSMIRHTYASMKGRGTHRAVHDLWHLISRTLFADNLWASESDYKKYYANIQHDRMKYRLNRKIKDRRMLWLLHVFIDSFPNKQYLLEHPEATADRGIPIGNIISPLLANFFLDEFDHYATEELKAYGYFRYADDILGVFRTKDQARDFRTALFSSSDDLDLTIKPNQQIYPLRSRSIDFVGYRISPHSIRLRKRNERKFRRSAEQYKRHPSPKLLQTLSARWGQIKHLSHGGRLWYSVLPRSIHQLNKESQP